MKGGRAKLAERHVMISLTAGPSEARLVA